MGREGGRGVLWGPDCSHLLPKKFIPVLPAERDPRVEGLPEKSLDVPLIGSFLSTGLCLPCQMAGKGPNSAIRLGALSLPH